ncbi:MAG: trypsin-like peptidase domain-containing protein [Candidatus Pseudobacter hemicellulosilyticus]|uniref:Trypsin-like peptidase domain-containing protein n=1 Tax=Candidatus Pseudobacter hemicellulosilyticus TaxID=3121375 RepID=A0AAJ6BHS7_9BACT|nr:MAG: trypsin-like peptidase domain-containing protein [Pseudobacter sp.]
MNFKQVVAVVMLSAGTTVATLWGYNHFSRSGTYVYQNDNNDTGKVPANYAGFNGQGGDAAPVDFGAAANAAIPATVHIKTKVTRTATNNLPRSRSPFSDMFDMDLDDFFGPRMRSVPQQASGSGAIISEDGYIVTNNHVVDGADEINVTLNNKKSFKAKLVAADPSSDLAVIKIEAKGLPFLLYANSDDVRVGQWVLAIGYPLSLETTVTAGIVSAKGRTLDINRRQSNTPVESFIQTDAAVNPGNSGGPLVNTDGKLIGINSAIASPTGAYAGYSFTIPVNIVKKIVADLMKHGTVQRAYLGIQYAPESLSDEERTRRGVKEGDGIYVLEAVKDGAASAAGIKTGDFITKINGFPVLSGAEMVGQIATYRPGDKVTVTYRRDGKESTTTVTLRNDAGNTDLVKVSNLDKLGADLATLSKEDAKELGINGGVVIKSIGATGIFSKVRVQEGYVILKADGKEVKSVSELSAILEKATGSVKLEGIYPGYEGVYPIVINMNAK